MNNIRTLREVNTNILKVLQKLKLKNGIEFSRLFHSADKGFHNITPILSLKQTNKQTNKVPSKASEGFEQHYGPGAWVEQTQVIPPTPDKPDQSRRLCALNRERSGLALRFRNLSLRSSP